MVTTYNDGKRIKLIYNYRSKDGKNIQFAPVIANSGTKITKIIKDNFVSRYPELRDLLDWKAIEEGIETKRSINVVKKGCKESMRKAVLIIKERRAAGKKSKDEKIQEWASEIFSKIEDSLSDVGLSLGAFDIMVEDENLKKRLFVKWTEERRIDPKFMFRGYDNLKMALNRELEIIKSFLEKL